MKYILAVLAIISFGGFGLFTYFNDNLAVGGGTGTLNQLNQWRSDGTYITQNTASTSIKLTGYESSGNCLVTNSNGVVSTSTCGGGGSSKWTDGGSFIYPTNGESIEVTSIAATSTATSSFVNLQVSTGLNLFGTIGAALSDFCVAITGGSGLCDGNDASGGGGGGSISTSTTPTPGNLAFWTSVSELSSVATGTLTETVSGLELSATRGLVGGAAILSLTSGYDIPLSASTTQWSGFYNTPSTRISAGNWLSWSGNTLNASVQISTSSNNGNLAFWTGSSALGNVATGTLTETVSGLELDATRGLVGGAAVLALTSGYGIPLTASTTEWTNFYNTPSGRITAGNHIDWTGNTLDVVTTGDWTGTIDGNNFAGGAIGAGDMLYGSGAGTLAELTIGASSSLLYSNGSTPAWGAASSLCILITGSAALCDGDDASGAGGGDAISTSTTPVGGHVAFWTSPSTLSSVATGTLTTTATGTQLSATRGLLGGDAIFSWATGYDAVRFASTTEWSGFYNTPSTRITAGTGIDWSGNTLNGVYTAGDALTLTGEDFDFDGGATPSGELGGTWASPTIDDSLAVTSWNLTTPTLTSFFGTPCTGNEFLQDISDTGAFTCAAASGGSGGGLSTTTPWTNGNLAYVTGLGTVGSVGTTTLVAGTGISFSGGTPIIIGSSPITIESTGGGGGGSLSTSTDIIGAPGTVESLSYVSDDFLIGGSSSTTAEFLFDPDGGQFFIASTSNSNATATIESTNNAQAVRIGDDIGSGLEYIFSTVGDAIIEVYGAVTRLVVAITETLFQGNVRITGKLFVASTTYNGATTTDAVVIDGFTNSGEWIEEFCTTPTGETTAITADTLRGCGRYAYSEDGAGQLDFVVPTTGTSTYFNLQPGATGAANAAGDGMLINWASGLDFGDIQRHQPAVEFPIRQDTVGNATGTTIQAGLTSAVGVNADAAAEPAQGFYVLATSTTPNYLFACNPPSGATTYIDTGIASSTTATASANPFVHFRLEISGTSNTAVTAILKARTTTDRNMLDKASCTLDLSASTQAVSPVVGIGKTGAGTSSDLHLMFLKFWYRQPVFY